MAVNKKSLENLKKGVATQFSSNNQPENSGRKPSVLSLIKDSGISIDDIRKIINSLIWEYPPAEISALLKDKTNPLPIGVTLVLGALIEDQKKKCINNFEKLMDRSHGKPTQPIDIPPDTRVILTREERQKRIEELLKKSEPKSKPKKSG